MADSTIKNLPLVSSISDDMSIVIENSSNTNEELQINQLDSRYSNAIPETTRTINFTSSQTSAQIQADINAVGKYIPEGVTITFQFGNGTYNLDTNIFFRGFYGGGYLNIQGDTTQTDDLHTNHNVHLDFSGDSAHGIILERNYIYTTLDHLRITCDDGFICVYVLRSPAVIIRYGYFINNGKTSIGSKGVFFLLSSTGEINDCYFSNNFYGITSSRSCLVNSNNNDDTGTQPNFGMRSETGGIIAKANTQPTGSTADESAGQGSNIF